MAGQDGSVASLGQCHSLCGQHHKRENVRVLTTLVHGNGGKKGEGES